MPDTSIVVSAKDNYSAVMKKMLTVTESFDKDLKKVEKQMVNLSRNKAQLKIDVKDAKQKLKETTENYEKLNNAANRFAMEMAQANYDKAVRNLNAVSKAAKDAEKHISKIENKAGSNPGTFSSSLNSIASAIATSGFGNMVGNLLMNVGTSYTASAHGDDAGIRTSSILSSAATGAAMGMILPGVGNLVGFIGGALAGAVTGAFSAEMQIYEKKDDFFKDYYKGLYEERQQAAESGLQGGSTTAGSREQSYKAFEKRLGKEEADAYLAEVKHMAARTNYGYDEILGYSKLLLNSYGTDEILGKDGAPGLLTTLSDATAGLNLASADVEMFIKGLSRMRTTGKVTQEYLNYFSERGVICILSPDMIE